MRLAVPGAAEAQRLPVQQVVREVASEQQVQAQLPAACFRYSQVQVQFLYQHAWERIG